jgi:MGT family glycosyltransferase
MDKAGTILIATWDGGGNVPPIKTLAQALVTRGHDVHVLGQESTRDTFEQAGSIFHQWATAPEPSFIQEFVPEEQEIALALEDVFFCKAYQSDLRSAIEELAPDVVMVDMSLRYAILEGLRVDQPLVVLCHTLYGSLVTSGEAGDNPGLRELNKTAIRDGVRTYDSRREMVESADRVLVFSYGGFDSISGKEAGEKVLHVSPLRPSGGVSSHWSRRFPERRLVLISLSTTDQNQKALLQRLCDACAELEVEALVTTGPIIGADELATAPNVTAIDFVNHDQVLAQVDLLVTHAGHGTVAAGVRHGVPMLCVPMGRDQDFNAARVEALGWGKVMDQAAPTDELGQTIREMLNDDDQKQRVESFARSLRSHPGVEDAMKAIEKTMSSS